MMYKAIIFDLDDTLYPEKNYFDSVFRSFINLNSWSIPKADIDQAVQQIDRKSTDILGDMLKNIGYYSVNNQEKFFQHYQNAKVELTLDDKVCKLLESLRRSGIYLGLLTNGVIASQRNKIEALKLHKTFDKIIIARESGAEKPEPDGYWKICNVLGLKVRQCLFVGDNLTTDIKGAANVGMDSAWLQEGQMFDNSIANPNYIIHDIVEVKGLCQI